MARVQLGTWHGATSLQEAAQPGDAGRTEPLVACPVPPITNIYITAWSTPAPFPVSLLTHVHLRTNTSLPQQPRSVCGRGIRRGRRPEHHPHSRTHSSAGGHPQWSQHSYRAQHSAQHPQGRTSCCRSHGGARLAAVPKTAILLQAPCGAVWTDAGDVCSAKHNVGTEL